MEPVRGPARLEHDGEHADNIDMCRHARAQDTVCVDMCEIPVGVTTKLQDLDYFMPTPRAGDAHILKINLEFEPGKLTAVLGPSGTGKTTLLMVLAGNVGGRMEGRVIVIGRFDARSREVADRLKRLQVLVPQDDTLYFSLSPRETLMFAARLRLPLHWTEEQKAQTVERVLGEMQLKTCCDIPVGNACRRGISGGQRRRVSIALELLVNPSVNLVDVSGVADVLHFALESASRPRHQSWALIQCVCVACRNPHRVWMLLRRKAWCVRSSVQPARATGLSLRPSTSPAGRFAACSTVWCSSVRAVSCTADPSHLCRNTSMTSASRRRPETTAQKERLQAESMSPSTPGDVKTETVPLWYQTAVLFRRCITESVKDRDKLLAGIILKLVVGLVVGVVWFNQADGTNKSILTVSGALFVALVLSVMDTLVCTVMTLPAIKPFLLREYKNNYFALLLYHVSLLSCWVIFNVLNGVVLALPIFFLVGIDFRLSMFLLFISILALLATISATLSLPLRSSAKDAGRALQTVMPAVIPLLLFSGYVISYDSLPNWSRWLYWCDPFAYALKALEITVFRHVTFTNSNQAAAQMCFNNGERVPSLD